LVCLSVCQLATLELRPSAADASRPCSTTADSRALHGCSLSRVDELRCWLLAMLSSRMCIGDCFSARRTSADGLFVRSAGVDVGRCSCLVISSETLEFRIRVPPTLVVFVALSISLSLCLSASGSVYVCVCVFVLVSAVQARSLAK